MHGIVPRRHEKETSAGCPKAEDEVADLRPITPKVLALPASATPALFSRLDPFINAMYRTRYLPGRANALSLPK